MKRNILKLVPFLLLPFMNACAPTPTMTEEDCTSVGAVFKSSSSEFSYTCESCEGKIIYKFKLIRGQSSLVIKVTTKVKSGSLYFLLEDDNVKNYYAGSINDYDEFTIAVAEFRTHVLTVTHTDFKGYYRFNWAH